MNPFAQTQFLWIMLAVLPLLAGFFIWTWRVKQKLIRQFVQARLLASLTVGVSPARQKLRLVLLFAAVTFILFALARPQWGFDWQEAKSQGIDIIVAIDTSRSMLAEDVPPNRLTRAKLAAFDLMRQAKNDRLGLIAFAGTAFLQAPLTLDENAFRQGVDALDIGIIPQGGTSLSDVINTAGDAFEKGSDNHKVLVIFTDGEDHDDDTATLAAAKEAGKNGLKIFTIGVGTPAGEMLRAKDENGNMDFIKDADGNAVKSHLNEDLLQKIASNASGFYLPLLGANPMETLYARGLAPLPKSDSSTKMTKVFNEHYHLPLGLAILCLIVEIFLPERRRVKQTEPARATEDLSGAKTATAIVTCLLLAPMLAFSSPSTAYKNFTSGKYTDSLTEYENLAAKKTNDYRLQYNAGTAAYKAKDLPAAQKHLNAVLTSPDITADLPTQQHTYYNLGNTLYQMGGAPDTDPDKQKELWEQSIENYNHALKLDAQDKDAKNNLEFVKQRLEELKKQQQQQQKNDQNKDDKDKKDDKDQKNQDQKDQKQDQKNDQNKDSKDQKDQKDQDKKDQQSKDQKNSQDKKDQQGKKDDKKSPQDKQKEEQQKQQQAQKDKDKEKAKQEKAQRDKEKKEKEKQAQEAADKNKDKGQNPEDQQEAQAPGQPARMTLQQAKQFLDAQKDQEKALIFAPENKPEKPRTGKFKDW